ncbi:hypothetical protein ACFX2I_010183 [Malus domestica]|uniref:senescence-specific cysteine protease SAG39-like n=1 Tax=Malus domestica TaxID=3750 RepID=UPI0010A9FA06|nr:ervatamin-B-like [Malus domestica]
MLERHEEWMARHGRVYKDAQEKERRYNTFKPNNVEFIKGFNKKGENQYTLGINKFADLTNEEFEAMHKGYKRRHLPEIMSNSVKAAPNNNFGYENVTDVPKSKDYFSLGSVTTVKDQRQCGCGWAFSAVAAIEGLNFLKTRNIVSLSEQELVDCDVGLVNDGCHYGEVGYAFEYMIERNRSLATDADYGYKGRDGGSCKADDYNNTDAAITVKGFELDPENNETALLQAVANQPVSVAIDDNGEFFQNYADSVFSGPCGTNLTHAVTIVGYGEEDWKKYWMIKNSWGEDWGDNGYMKLQRDVPAEEGLCGIAMAAYYPTSD